MRFYLSIQTDVVVREECDAAEPEDEEPPTECHRIRRKNNRLLSMTRKEGTWPHWPQSATTVQLGLTLGK